MTDLDPVAAVVLWLVALPLGLLVPGLIARIPEPPPDEEPPEEDAEIPPGSPDEDPVALEEPKELYATIAQLPGLAWKSALASGVSAALIGLGIGWAWPLLFLVPLVPVSVALAVVDWRTRLLPTWVIVRAFLASVVLVLAAWLLEGNLSDPDDLIRAAAGCAAAAGMFYVLWWVYPRGMGFGDVRLSGLLGLTLGYLGWGELVVGIYSGFLLGGVIGGLLALLRRVDRKGYPVGPFMLVGALVGILFGPQAVSDVFA